MMEGNVQDDMDPVANAMKDNCENFVQEVEQDKKSAHMMGGVMACFSSVMSVFGRTDLKPPRDEDWEVSADSLTDQVYLGSGAQGVVFSANLRGEMVAVKKLRDRSETNIKHLRKLNHDNIVRFRGVCTASPHFCVIMEFCQYGPLFEFLHSGACFAPKQILKWAKEIAQGVAYLHSHKIIHRDLKSPNILIADNLVVKVSDFGTSREWNDVSTIMSFTGTVAWMAPEVIRHEPCSERVDVWSYGVVLWELLTQEVPYKNLETNAIMWGVGTDTISLPVPCGVPPSMQMLLNQCWSRVARNRPPFKIIAAHLEMAGQELLYMIGDVFGAAQATWRNEVRQRMDTLYSSEEPVQEAEVKEPINKRDEVNQARDIRQVYQQQLNRTNELYMEVCAVRLQLEQREKAIAEREQALKACRCGFRKNFKYYQRQSSSSSEGMKTPGGMGPRPRLVETIAPAPATLMAADADACRCDNNNLRSTNITVDTVVEENGNVELLTTAVDPVTIEINETLEIAQV